MQAIQIRESITVTLGLAVFLAGTRIDAPVGLMRRFDIPRPVTGRYGPAPLAFVLLPLVSAFFVDLANSVVIQWTLRF